MTSTRHWHHGKYDGLLSRYHVVENSKLALPAINDHPASLFLAIQTLEGGWWLQHVRTPSQYQAVPSTDYEEPLFVASFKPWELEHARVITMTLQEASHFPHGVALSSMSTWPAHCSLDERIATLHRWHTYHAKTLRVDFQRFSSPMDAWRWRSLRRIARDWRSECRATHQWARSIDDRPWQEARMAYDLEDQPGGVLDIRSAYACGVEHLMFPRPGTPWADLKPGTRHEHAMHAIAWTPTDYQGRFYHPWRYNLPGASDMPAYGLSDMVHTWVLDHDLPWLSRHGVIHGVHQSVCPSLTAHPLANTMAELRGQLANQTIPEFKALLKKRLVSTHTWTWQPQHCYIEATQDVVMQHSLEEYMSRPGPQVGNLRMWNDAEIGDVVESVDALHSGYYTPIMWLRMNLRSHLLRRVEWALQQKATIAYVNVDGIHLRAPSHEVFDAVAQWEDPHQPWWTWRVDSYFRRGFWMRPGVYALQRLDGQWDKTENWPDNLTHSVWPDWVGARGALDARDTQGYWRRACDPARWQGPTSITLGSERKLRNLLRQWLG